MITNPPRVLLTTLLCCLTLAAVAPTAAAQRQHDAHEHGRAQLNLAVDAGTLVIELTAAAADLVGFEHPARTPEQQAAIRSTLATLEHPAALYAIPAAAGCVLTSARSGTGLPGGGSEAGHEHPGDSDHDHAGESGQHHESESHADFNAEYVYACTDPGRLEYLDVRLFDRFPAIRHLAVQYVTARGQGALELAADAPRLRLQ